MKYVYPAIFNQTETGIDINFPDFESCYTSATNLVEALEMAKDVLCLTLYDFEENNENIPYSTDIQNIKVHKNSFASYVECNTDSYRRMNNNKSVKKNLTIPSWLNDLAVENNVNFSQMLQNALIKELQIEV